MSPTAKEPTSTQEPSSTDPAAGKPASKEPAAGKPAASGKGDVLALEGLTVARGGRSVVREVSLRVAAGEVTALLGANGAGKSSLVLAVGGVLRPEAGRVRLNGDDLSGRRPEKIRAAGVAVVPEGRRLLPDLSVEDNLRVATYALPRREADAGVNYALEMFPELKQRFSTTSRSLSGGEQQMVVLAQALVSKPKFILIDELSLGLAPVVVKRLVPTIQELAESGIGVLLIEQFATIALGMAKDAYVMGHGRIEFSGTAGELKRKPELLESAYLTRAGTSNGGESK
ncbi:MAG TPA: ABC transporter ATP-binding protein [Solirubrobacterales bacterium]|jgi:branched-chain amino acid transport system ATP-binding protein